jgi:hypothetical protein
MSQTVQSERVDAPADEPPVQAPQERQAEEMRMLLFGFGTGMAIAGIFLIYVVLDIAKLL